MKRPRKSPTNELTASIIRYLCLNGCDAWRNNNGAVYDAKIKGHRRNPTARKGIPDVLGYLRNGGRLIAIEVKGTAKDELSREQEMFLRNASMAGCIAFEARNFDQFVEEFSKRTGKTAPFSIKRERHD